MDQDNSAITNALTVLFSDNISDKMLSSHMVALPVVEQRTTTSASNHNIPCTAIKLSPRKGVTDAWHEQMNDLLSLQGLTKVSNEEHPPSLAIVTSMLPGVPDDLVAAVHEVLHAKWWEEATRLYYIVRASTEFTGIYEFRDMATIKTRFWQGDERDGPGFLKWVISFTDHDSVGAQSKLMEQVMSTKLPANCTQDQFGTHCSNLLLKFFQINSNDIKRPAGFYHTLLKSLPDTQTGNIWHLRCWLSDKMADNDPLLADPNLLIERFIARAQILGLPAGGGSINALTGNANAKNNCKFCAAAICRFGSIQKL